MKGEDGRAPLGEAVEHYGWRCRPGRGAQEQEWSVCLPSYTSGIQEKWIPRQQPASKFQIFKSSVISTFLSIPTTCSTNNNNQHRPQTYVLELTSKFLDPLFNESQ